MRSAMREGWSEWREKIEVGGNVDSEVGVGERRDFEGLGLERGGMEGRGKVELRFNEEERKRDGRRRQQLTKKCWTRVTREVPMM